MQCYVYLVTDKIYLKNVNSEITELLLEMGAIKNADNNWEIIFSDNNELANIFSKLREIGIAFSAGSGWSPAEQFEKLRSLDLLKGKYKKIMWYNKDNFKIVES